jgi:enoyl-CoA hydratase/carnithine racemase
MEIVASREGGVLEIALDRPQKKNAITAGMYADLARTLREAEADENVRVVLFRGNGDSFCAGNDLEDFAANPGLRGCAGLAPDRIACDQALVAAGPRLGSRSNDAPAALRVCLRRRRRTLPAALHAAGARARVRVSYLLPLFAGYHRAAELLLLGEPVDARVAYDAGFVTRVVPKELVVETAREAARKLAALPPKSVQRTKILMRGPHAAAVELQRKAEAEWFRPMLGEPAARAALEAFLTRRKG